MATQYVCDACREVIGEARVLMHAQTQVVSGYEYALPLTIKKDLCSACAEKFRVACGGDWKTAS